MVQNPKDEIEDTILRVFALNTWHNDFKYMSRKEHNEDLRKLLLSRGYKIEDINEILQKCWNERHIRSTKTDSDITKKGMYRMIDLKKVIKKR